MTEASTTIAAAIGISVEQTHTAKAHSGVVGNGKQHDRTSQWESSRTIASRACGWTYIDKERRQKRGNMELESEQDTQLAPGSVRLHLHKLCEQHFFALPVRLPHERLFD